MKYSKAIPVTAVFDIGKTNKKFLLFDEDYNIVFKQQSILEQSEDQDGYPCEDIRLLTGWITNKFRLALQDEDFNITSLNVSTYGASLVHLDEHGEIVGPLYNYLKPYPEDLRQRFYETYGGREKFSLETASPPMGMLNSGLQLYWLKHKKPLLYQKIRHSLHLPQYVSSLFTGRRHAELTSIGCHTALWNYEQNKYHHWLEQEGLLRLFPPVQPASGTIETTYNNSQFEAGMGIHDSSAALAPCLFAFDDPFLLISTGTWSITLNPFNRDPLTFEELQKDCLCYLTIFGDQVKASRLFLGNEYAHQKQKLEAYFNRKSTEAGIDLDPVLLRNLIDGCNPAKKLELETAHNSGPYPRDKPGEWDINEFSSYKEAYHQLMLDLVSIQADCIEIVQGSLNIEKLIITGGFSKNDFFVKILASRFPGKKVYTASLPLASALGAAMVINNNQSSEESSLKKLLNLKRHVPLENTGIEQYRWG